MPVLPIVIFIVIVLAICCIKIVPQTYVYVIERLGRYEKSCGAGVNLIIPVIDRVANRVSMKEQVLDFPPQSVITKDNVTINIDSVVFMRVTDPKLFTYGVQNPIDGIANLSATTLRSIIGAMDFDETLSSREQINKNISDILDKATDPWGIKVTRVEVKDITPPKNILQVMQKQMTAEREKRQAILEAEGYKQSSITHAEGDKQAKVLAAEAEAEAAVTLARGRAESIRLVCEAEAAGLEMLIDKLDSAENALRLKAIQAMSEIADGNATKIFFPSDMPEIATLGLAGEALDIKGASPASGKKAAPDPSYIKHDSPVGSSRITERVIDHGHKAQADTAQQMPHS